MYRRVGVVDGGIRRIWGFGWKWNLEQTCRWSGKTPARLVFEQVQKEDGDNRMRIRAR